MNKEKRTELKNECVEKLKNINAIEMLEKAIEMFQFVLNGKEHMEFKIGEDRGVITSECAKVIIPIMIDRNKKKIAELNKEIGLESEDKIGKIVSYTAHVKHILEFKTNSEERKTLINKLIDDLNNREIKNPSKEVQILQYLNSKKLLRNVLLQAYSIYFNGNLISLICPWEHTKQKSKFWDLKSNEYQKWYNSKFKD